MVASSWLITSYLVLCYGVAVDWLILLVMVGCGAFYLQVTIVFCFWFFYGSRFLKDSDDKYQKGTILIMLILFVVEIYRDFSRVVNSDTIHKFGLRTCKSQ